MCLSCNLIKSFFFIDYYYKIEIYLLHNLVLIKSQTMMSRKTQCHFEDEEIERQEELIRRQLVILEQNKSLKKRITETKEKFSEELKWFDAEKQALRDETKRINKEIQKTPRPKAPNTPRPKAPNTPRPKAPNTPRPKDTVEDETNTIVSGETKKQIRSVISRDIDATFAGCDRITITENFKKQTASLVLVRTIGEINWKKGAWKDEEGISYTTPNVAWEALIGRTWGEKGPRKSNVWAKEGRLVATRNGFPDVDVYKYPFSVIMKLDKCSGSYFGKKFSELTEADFRQI
jgi:hypothetical protein